MGYGKEKTVLRYLEFGFVVKPVQELNRCQIYVIERRKKKVHFPRGSFFSKQEPEGKEKTVKLRPSYLLF